MTRHSAIYAGTVRHRRFAERDNEFTTRIALAYVDLDELPGLPLNGPVRFRRSDYLGDPAKPLDAEVRDLVQRRTGTRPQGPIRLLTQLRSFGHCFNPVSFYYCFDDDEETQRVEAVVADVTNTPWGERHAYVIEKPRDAQIVTGDSDKLLHVSPFMDMDHRYDWRVSEPGETLSVHIESLKNPDAKAFDATLNLRRRALTTRNLARCAGSTLRTVALIYAHALRLKLKGVRVRPHPKEAAL